MKAYVYRITNNYSLQCFQIKIDDLFKTFRSIIVVNNLKGYRVNDFYLDSDALAFCLLNPVKNKNQLSFLIENKFVDFIVSQNSKFDKTRIIYLAKQIKGE